MRRRSDLQVLVLGALVGVVAGSVASASAQFFGVRAWALRWH